jgi:hypothetical protein
LPPSDAPIGHVRETGTAPECRGQRRDAVRGSEDVYDRLPLTDPVVRPAVKTLGAIGIGDAQ